MGLPLSLYYHHSSSFNYSYTSHQTEMISFIHTVTLVGTLAFTARATDRYGNSQTQRIELLDPVATFQGDSGDSIYNSVSKQETQRLSLSSGSARSNSTVDEVIQKRYNFKEEVLSMRAAKQRKQE